MHRQASTGLQFSTEEFELFRGWINEHAGIFLEDSKADSLRLAVATRSAFCGAQDCRDYYRVVRSDEEEFKQLMNLVTVNETSFFRFPAQFELLRDAVIPEVLARGDCCGRRGVRIWSAGCSTGEEPYTLAITAMESGLGTSGRPVEILGTDVSTEALERARRAIYPTRSLRNMSSETVGRWFEPIEEGFRPVRQVREACRFAYHNMIKDAQPSPFGGAWDVIFCRNVTIYFQHESTKRLVQRFFEALEPGGFLFVGHSETLASFTDSFEAIEVDGVFVYRKPDEKRTYVAGKASDRGRSDLARTALDRSATAFSHGRRDTLSRRDQEEAFDGLAQAHELLEGARAQEALDIAVQALAQEPGNREARLVAAYAHADLGHPTEAAAQAEAALALDPLAAPARYVLGVVRCEQGDLDGALAEFRRTLYADKDFVLAHFAIANVQRRRGNLTEAVREYERTMRALLATPEGPWTAFLGGFGPDLLMRTCELGLVECAQARVRR